MRAVVVKSPGGIEAMQLTNVPDPTLADAAVLIDVAYAGCNWMDTQKRQGVYPDPVSYPVILGNEVSGYVSAVGAGVGSIEVGARVAAIVDMGGYAERCVAEQDSVVILPDAVPLDVGASFQFAALTAYHLLHSAYQIRPDETVLVHAIGGGVGLMVTQVATEMGANVIGTVSSHKSEDRATEFGAKLVIDRSKDDFVEAVMDFTGGNGVDLVIDSLGGETSLRSFDTLKVYGHLINIGEAEGWTQDDKIRNKLYERSTSFSGFEMIHANPGSRRWKNGVAYVVERLADGRLVVPIVKEFALGECQDMHRLLESRSVSGKLVLKVQK